jgi:glycosyltransferase involved in cell wall biosynthesis
VLICLSSNTAWNIYNFRAGLVRALIQRGHSVLVLAPRDEASTKLVDMGCKFVHLPMDNRGTNPLRDVALIARFLKVLRRLRPHALLTFTIKPVIYGGLAARILAIPYVTTVTGLGTVFIRQSWVTKLVYQMYRVSQSKVDRVFFQNTDDFALFQQRRLVPPQRSEVIAGSGVDTERFGFVDLRDHGEAPIFLLVSRLLWDKGIGEYVEAARLTKQFYPLARFQVLGRPEPEGEGAIPRTMLEAWVREGVIEYLGGTDDVRPYIANADCVVLPSYREGTPRSLLEAAAMGRPIVASDAVGCRNVVDNGESGLLCRPRDANDLANTLVQFAGLPQSRREEMGRRGRLKVEAQFTERKVIARYMGIIEARAVASNIG